MARSKEFLWDPGDRDVDGLEEEAIRPSLIEDIQKVLREYPDDGQILKEMVQNAEDADASRVIIVADTRKFHQNVRQDELNNYPHLHYLKGPALCVYNNGLFTDDDWKSIRMLHKSIKEKKPMKVGRFGLGFKSVFHLTDRVVILSGDKLMYMDPSKDERRYCTTKHLSDIRGRELQSVLHCLGGSLLGISQDTVQTGHFRGTVFWFPLRQIVTDTSTSSTIYTDDNLFDLLNSLKQEGSTMLLFLNNITCICGYWSRKESSNAIPLFSITIALPCRRDVTVARQKFKESLPGEAGALPSLGVYSDLMQLTTETYDCKTKSRENEQWLVVSYFPGSRELNSEETELCTDPRLNYRPGVGVASALSGDTIQSQVFCTLPLPLDTRSMTGLPVHVNGGFAVSQNRRNLEWPDQRRSRKNYESSVKWNLFLIEVLLPRAYTRLLECILEQRLMTAAKFYGILPELAQVNDRWKPLAQTVYADLAARKAFFTRSCGGQWITLREAVLSEVPDVQTDVADAVREVYRTMNENLLDLPNHVMDGLNQQGLLTFVTRVTPDAVKQFVSSCVPRLTRQNKLHVLEYLCSQGAPYNLLTSLQLLPLADGTFAPFTSRWSSGGRDVYLCDGALQALFPGIQNRFCETRLRFPLEEHLRRIAESGAFSLHVLSADSMQLPQLIEESLRARSNAPAPILPSGDPWIEQLWQFLSGSKPWSEDLGRFMNMTLLPAPQGRLLKLLPLSGLYICHMPWVGGVLSQDLFSCLAKLGITVLFDLPHYVTTHRKVLGHIVQYSNIDGILTALGRIAADSWMCRQSVSTFNSDATELERQGLVDTIASARNINRETRGLLRQLALFTEAETNRFVRLEEVDCFAGPGILPPVRLPRRMLCHSGVCEMASGQLGARTLSLADIVSEMLQLMSVPTPRNYSASDVDRFMTYVICNKDFMADKNIRSLAKQVPFVLTRGGQRRTAGDLYDPTSPMLVELFAFQDRLPAEHFSQTDMLKKFEKLGMRSETCVDAEHLIATAKHIESEFAHGSQFAALRESEAVWKFLMKHGDSLDSATLEKLSTIQCLPCLQSGEKPEGYPKSLPLKSTPTVAKAQNIHQCVFVKLLGSAEPVMRPGLSKKVSSGLQTKAPTMECIVQHVRNIAKHFSADESALYRLLLTEIFKILYNQRNNTMVVHALKAEKCVLLESGDRFVQPCCIWVTRESDDLNLRPYRYPLAVDFEEVKELLLKCGAAERQDEKMLREVILQIQQDHENTTEHHPRYKSDLNLVITVLNKLTEETIACDGSVPVPIISQQNTVLRFKPAGECTVLCTGNPEGSSDSDDLCFVHPSVPQDTALKLGALDMRDQSLAGLEAIDSSFSQHEDIRDRIRDLLEHSYRDGLSVPKELIQNADDAGASEVCFLLDERENLDASENSEAGACLLFPKMASQQGPAIWAYNDAVFSDDDFANICRLGARTKEEDSTKVGKFGLGFNVVYNLTDTPCVLSGYRMGMFDPERKYLKGQAGMCINFQHTKNQALLSRWPQQFKPFQGIFGCLLTDKPGVFYNGTLFRFPLRTRQQAEESHLKAKCYDETKRRELFKLILESAGNLLLFTQNVQTLKVFYIPQKSADPASPQCLLTVNKTSKRTILHEPGLRLGDESVLRFCSKHFDNLHDIRILEDLDIRAEMTSQAHHLCRVVACSSSTHWRLAWTTGIGESAQIAFASRNKLLPLATVAVSLSDRAILPLKTLPASFYTVGHLFCFLPLPQNLVRAPFPVHINSTFSLASSRRGVLEQTEEEFDSMNTEWNRALYADPICRAYTLLLENLHTEAAGHGDYTAFFALWPRAENPDLKRTFYTDLIDKGITLFPVPHSGQWVGFHEAVFLESGFRESEVGDICWKVLQMFWDGGGSVVDIPADICRTLQETGGKRFKKRVVTKAAFYKRVFLPNISSDRLLPEKRDRIVLYALLQEHQELQNLLRVTACIPCEGTTDLRIPRQLVHPEKEAAKLFLPSDGVFPVCRKGEKNNFCTQKILERLEKLGMVTDDLASDQVLERASSVGRLYTENTQQALDRVRHLILYLSTYSPANSKFRFDLLPGGAKSSLSEIRFLPVMKKPDNWPFPWEGTVDPASFAAPKEIFSDSLQNIVACKAKLFDSKAIGLAGSQLIGKTKNVMQAVGVGVKEDYTSESLMLLVIRQLESVIKEHQTQKGIDEQIMGGVVGAVYKFLTECLRQSRRNDFSAIVFQNLASAPCVLIGTDFVFPKQVAFQNDFDCRPYLLKLDNNLLQYRTLFEVIGVREEFDVKDGVQVLQLIHGEYSGRTLPEDTISLASRVAQLLSKAVKQTGECLDGSIVYLPDREGHMQRADRLALDDSKWLRSTLHFVSDQIPAEAARLLGVKTKKRQDFLRLAKAIPWGQKEELTVRIKRLLEGYTCDSVLKELVQNADDAGATEIKFIKDLRTLKTKKVLDGWEQLQGPALCVYNNAFFTDDDLDGIIKVGEGSKALAPLKTGQYGVGFIAVHHITDTPSFWTRESEENQAFVTFDPNCLYLPIDDSGAAGYKFDDVEYLKKSYPEMFKGYMFDSIDMTKPGTIFRLPLRTEQMAETSKIKKEPMPDKQLKQLLDSFKINLARNLLFLKNLRSMAVYSVNVDTGKLELEYEVRTDLDDTRSKEVDRFEQAVNSIKEGVHPCDIAECQSVMSLTMTDSSNKCEKWLAVHRVGFASDTFSERTQKINHWQQLNLLPRGGVAVRVFERAAHGPCSVPKYENGVAFCMLPLPVETGLPVHVNGHFALDQETRRSLWDNKEDARTEWNKALALQVVVPAYITAIERVKSLWFSKKQELDASTLVFIKHYHTLFPSLDKATSPFWKLVMEELYRQIGRRELPLFPVVNEASSITAWVPVVKSDGFPGYFSDAIRFFRDSLQQKVHITSVGSQESTQRILEREKVAGEMKDRFHKLLKKLNMGVLETPYHVMKNFIESGETRVKEMAPVSVIIFLKSQHVDGCNIESLPRPVGDTSFKDASNVQLLLRFLTQDSAFFDHLDGLPLCLRQSGDLHVFQVIEDSLKPIASRHFSLLPGSSSAFLHEKVFKYFLPVLEKTTSMIHELNIPVLSQMLSDTLSEATFKTGRPCLLLQDELPDRKWLKNVWIFLEEQLVSCKGAATAEYWRTLEEKLESIQDWSLIPARKETGITRQLFLFPVKDGHRVIHLSAERDVANPQLWETLKTLPLAFLETSQLPPLCIAEDIVASISHPAALLQALISCEAHLTSSRIKARCVLNYFDTSLPTLQEAFHDESKLIRKLKSLPFFVDIDEKIGPISDNIPVLCIDSDVPGKGLASWALERHEHVTVLRRDNVPEGLRDFLRFSVRSNTQFYQLDLLPSIAALPRNVILTHVIFVKKLLDSQCLNETEMEKMCAELKNTAFIEFDGLLCKAQYFYSPHEQVFLEMCRPPEKFPPEPYCSWEWNDFMRKAGIVWKVTEQKFLEFAFRLRDDSGGRITEKTTKRSDLLVRHLFHRNDLKETRLVEQLRFVRFLRPLDWLKTSEGQRLAVIAEPLAYDHLISFDESCSRRHLYLVWTSTYILHETADPASITDSITRNEVMRQLDWQQQAPKETVMEHVRKLCSSLDNSTVWENYDKYLLEEAMSSLYRYLEEQLQESELAQIAQLPVICDVDIKRMLLAENVLIDILQEETITGYIHRLPFQFHRFRKLFQRLGVQQQVTANHYARVLSQLKSRWGHQELHVEAMKIVKQAVHGLFKCLGLDNEQQSHLTIHHVYLPSENHELVKSTQLVYKNRERLVDRIKELPQRNMRFFLNFSEMEIFYLQPEDKVTLLPQDHRMKYLSDIVKEIIPEDVKHTATDGEYSRRLADMLVHVEYIACVVRLAYHQHKEDMVQHKDTFNQKTEQQVREKLSLISVKEVTGLRTVLALDNEILPNSDETKRSFVGKGQDGSYTLYIDNISCRSAHDAAQDLARAVQFALHFRPGCAHFLKSVFVDPKLAAQEMDEFGISEYNSTALRDGSSVFPTPGAYVPLRFHCYLDNSLDCVFADGEYVGFEVEDEFNENETEDNVPTYVYAVVRRRADGGDDDTPPWTRQYIVDVGFDFGGEIQVSCTVLFKFGDPRPRMVAAVAQEEADAALVPVGEQPAEGEDAGGDAPLNINEVLRNIRQILTDAWRQPDLAERRRVVRRLYLQWHPDKNPPENAPFYTQVTQTIQRYVQLLEQGRLLPTEEAQDVADGSDFESSFSSFFSRMDARSRRHRDYYEANAQDFDEGCEPPSSGGMSWYKESTRRANPQPGDARRWMRQAEADLAAAQAARGSCDRGHCWVCYMSHQAMEKALKAVLLHRDANMASLSHEITVLAAHVGDVTLSELASELEICVGHHTRMRYPEAHEHGKIPAEVYSYAQACEACNLTEQALQEVHRLLHD